jgi:hypothetical protein
MVSGASMVHYCGLLLWLGVLGLLLGLLGSQWGLLLWGLLLWCLLLWLGVLGLLGCQWLGHAPLQRCDII